ncbi:MAG: NIPSNAP family containing protein [Chloroflexi bacterium]|nr:NIPSNAP family containing protein [Chloroflexota bacterium]
MAFFELREYRMRPGQRENWIKYMDEVIIPFLVSKGMVVVGSFAGETEEDLWVWIRRFEDEEERERLYAAVFESEEWKTRVAPPIGAMVDGERMVVRRLVASPRSIIR